MINNGAHVIFQINKQTNKQHPCLHGWCVRSGDELVFQPDELSEFGVLLESVGQPCNPGRQKQPITNTATLERKPDENLHGKGDPTLTHVSDEVLRSMSCVHKMLAVVVMRVQTLRPLIGTTEGKNYNSGKVHICRNRRQFAGIFPIFMTQGANNSGAASMCMPEPDNQTAQAWLLCKCKAHVICST